MKNRNLKWMSVVAASLLASQYACADNTTILPVVEVTTAENIFDETTEKTNSYTTKAMSTATGLSMSIKETPQSVTVVTRERLDDQNLQSLHEVMNNVTGISVNQYDSARHIYTARGFELNNLLIDGIPTMYSGWLEGQEFMDTVLFDRIEVVRGATGLLVGEGDPSAAINMVRKRAKSKTFSGEVEAEYGSWNHYRTTVDISSPITKDGKVRARFVGGYQNNDSFVDLLEDTKKIAYLNIEADLTDQTLLSAGFSYQKNEQDGTTWGGLPQTFSDDTFTDWDHSKTTAADWTFADTTHTSYFADLEHIFDNGAKLKAGYTHTEVDAKSKLLYLSGNLDKTTGTGLSPWPDLYDTDRTQDTVNISLDGVVELFGRKHELIAGARYGEETFNAWTTEGNVYDPSTGNFYLWDGSYAEPVWGSYELYDTVKKKETGAFAAGRFSLTDSLKLILGSRITNYEKKGHGMTLDPYTIKHSNILTPYAGLVYDLTDEISIYASYTDIFKNQEERDRNGKYLDPITGETYEIGVKGEFAEGRVNTGLTIYQIRQDNLAQDDIGYFVPGTGGAVQASYAATGTKSEGYELDVSGEVLPNWNLSAGWSQFWTKDASGNAINTQNPRKLLKLYSKYKTGNLSIGGGVNWESERYYVDGSNRRIEQSPYALVNVMVRYDFTKNLFAQLNVDNLFDKEYYSQFDFYDQVAYGTPRSAKLSMSYKF